MQTRDQEYASDVYERVQVIKEKKDRVLETRYGSMAHKLPILIHTSGLAQALAFVDSRGKISMSGERDGSQRLLEDLSQTVLRKPATELLKYSRGDAPESNLREYIRLTEQTLAALLWYKRYAQSILNVELGTKEEGQE
jgi:CRISPR-associated protein Cmr5